jgi:hypothetical protein
MSTALSKSLSTVFQYLTFYRLFVQWLSVHCCLLQFVKCLAVPHTVPSLVSVSLCPMLPSIFFPQSVCPHTITSVDSVSVCPLLSYIFCHTSLSNSHGTVRFFFVPKSTAFFYGLSTVCYYLTLYRLLYLCHYFQTTL